MHLYAYPHTPLATPLAHSLSIPAHIVLRTRARYVYHARLGVRLGTRARVSACATLVPRGTC